MGRDELDQQLRQWGHALNGRHEVRRSENDPGSHPISKARQFAMKPKDFIKKVAGRDGRDRRTAMAAGTPGQRISPMWASDPITCKETRPSGSGAAVDQGVPSDLMWIEKAAMALYRQHPIRGVVLRFEYSLHGPQKDKAAKVSEAVGEKVTLRRYREEKKLALEWVQGRLTA